MNNNQLRSLIKKTIKESYSEEEKIFPELIEKAQKHIKRMSGADDVKVNIERGDKDGRYYIVAKVIVYLQYGFVQETTLREELFLNDIKGSLKKLLDFFIPTRNTNHMEERDVEIEIKKLN